MTERRRNVVLVCDSSGRTVDGIRDHAACWCDALRRCGVDAVVVDLGVAAPRRLRRLRTARRLATLTRRSVVVLEYAPFAFARWGFAPELIAGLALGRPRRLVLSVHEPYVDERGARQALMGAWQRLQLWMLRRLARVVVVSISAWRDVLDAWRPARPTVHLPVGSNFAEPAADAASSGEVASVLGPYVGGLVVGCLSPASPGVDRALLQAAFEAIHAANPDSVLLAIGPLPDAWRTQPPSWLRASHVVAADAVHDYLRRVDLFLAPFVDGVSTRRTSVMAALQAGRPVVTTAGPLTDPEWAALEAVALAQPRAFVAASVALADDAERRAGLAARGRTIYHEHYAHDVTIERFLRVCREASIDFAPVR